MNAFPGLSIVQQQQQQLQMQQQLAIAAANSERRSGMSGSLDGEGVLILVILIS
jgi:hypothetical protein